MLPVKILSAAVLLSMLPLSKTFAQDESAESVNRHDPNLVFAYQGDAIVSQAALDAAFSRIPEQDRLLFIRDGAKVDRMVQSLLQTEVIAADARAHEFTADPLIQERMRLAAQKELAEAWLAEIIRRAPDADYAAMAEEDYLANPQKYAGNPELDVTHILIDTTDRTVDEARNLAYDLYARMEDDPALFATFVTEYSDDPSKLTNFGKYSDIQPGQMAPAFEKTAYGLTQVGEISEPIKTRFGYHLIRLDRRVDQPVPPFEEIRESVIAQMKARHLEEYRVLYLQKLMASPIVLPEGAVEIMAKRYFGENLENATIFGIDGPEENE